jgi:hypothetical protein
VLLVNSPIQTSSEHDGDKDRAALAALLTRMTGAYQGPVRRVREVALSRSARQLAEMTAYARTPHFQRRAPANLPPCLGRSAAAGQGARSSPAHPAAPCVARPPTAMQRMPPSQSWLVR